MRRFSSPLRHSPLLRSERFTREQLRRGEEQRDLSYETMTTSCDDRGVVPGDLRVWGNVR